MTNFQFYQATNPYLESKKFWYFLRKELRCFLAQYPSLFLSQRKKLYGFIDQERMIDLKTEIVIEGFPGSANSFSVLAFKMSQNRDVNIAHHMHDPSQIIAAVKIGIPAIALIRLPEDAILSYIVRFSSFADEQQVIELINNQLKKYIDFYQKILIYKQHLVIADFKTLTNSYESIIQQVNNKYNTSFKLFYCNEQNTKQVFEQMNQLSKQKFGHVNENAVSRPSINKEKAKKELAKYFKLTNLSGLLATAHNLYEEVTAEQ